MEEKITLHGKVFKPYITHEKIMAAVEDVAAKVNKDFAGCEDVPIVLCVLNGAIPFTAALLVRLKFQCELVSIKMSSYQGTKSTGTVLNVMGLTADVKGRRIILCEDIVDTGNTIVALKELLLSKGAADVKICTMLLKPAVYNKSEKINYVGMEIPNAFIVGFGLDYDEIGRNYEDIYVIDENNMKYYILFGPPGAGKGTHAGAIAEKYNYKHISTGELLRAEIAAGTELGKKAKDLIAAGSLVPDEVVEGMIESAFDKIKGYDGFLLDGFPRNINQAKDLDKILEKRGTSVTALVSIMISDETVRARIAHRAAIEGRADDASEETITNRIATYHAQTEPLIEYYKAQGKYYECNGDSPDLDTNRRRVLAMVESINGK